MNEIAAEISFLKQQLEEAQRQNRLIQEELAATNRGLLALTIELEEKKEEVQAITQQLLQVAKMATMGELAAGIAHELNNPLATVSLRVETLATQISPDDLQQQRSLQIISREIERMGNLIKNLLHSSRHSRRHISTVDVREVIEYTLELIYYQFRKNRISVRRECQPGLPLIYADCQGLMQLFLNLFTNACDAMPQGGKLAIRLYAEHADIDCVAIEISDTGIGIHHDHLAKVMDPFFTTKPEGKGTGLGLSICRRIVREHHGSITITSEIDKGTTIYLKLPVIKE